MHEIYQQYMTGGEKGFEEVLVLMGRKHPWVLEDGTGIVKQAGAVWNAVVAGEAVDAEVVAETFLGLARCAEVAGDVLGAWVLGRCYHWTCALMCGEQYVIPVVPDEVVRLVEEYGRDIPGSPGQWEARKGNNRSAF